MAPFLCCRVVLMEELHCWCVCVCVCVRACELHRCLLCAGRSETQIETPRRVLRCSYKYVYSLGADKGDWYSQIYKVPRASLCLLPQLRPPSLPSPPNQPLHYHDRPSMTVDPFSTNWGCFGISRFRAFRIRIGRRRRSDIDDAAKRKEK